MDELKLGLELTLEQQFRLTALRSAVQDASKEQLAEMVPEITRQLFLYKNIASQYMRKQLKGEVDVSIEFVTSD